MRACVRECARGCAGVNICVCVGALTDGSLVCLFVCVRASSRVLFCVHGHEIFREGCNVRHKKAIYTHKHAHTRTYIHTHTHRPRPHLINALHEYAQHTSSQRHAVLTWLNQQTLDSGWKHPCSFRLYIFRCIYIDACIYI